MNCNGISIVMVLLSASGIGLGWDKFGVYIVYRFRTG
jgi:hypothetical protein